jgi:hypothetical protein
MVRSTVVALVVVLLVAKAVSGLNLIPTHWEERTTTVNFPSQSTKALEIATSNGTVEFVGQEDSAKTVEFVALCKAGASTSERAQQALDAIEVTADGKETETCRIGWRWRTPQESDWSAAVDFTIRAPKNVNLQIESHNGRLIVKNLAGNAKITTHNGRIDAETTGASLNAETNNGEINAKFSGQKVNLHSHNGRIEADLSGSRSIEGEIATHNGLVEITVGKLTSCELITKMRHGWRKSHGGKIGSGGRKLVASSRNVAVLINGSSIDEW